ncbi:hypothetical protein BU25DRAFT_419446 [Macroventuria anomochaeta]|uniref:Uncharacterized protein n=1 Tax=Macroventuria anomochaeta TaxID=301207 RepID=A0ACB6S8Y4_9PLEO|nr:uncharacterized protein BU25DRAFT_419446 [Macroventuria anomochaeta]KAF2630467.1 hypothetical protein BU25DRAFT_419446 [Macroventuria anomochaeta]
MLLQRLSGLAVIALVASTAATNSTCYYPNGEKNNGGACNANTEVSMCCGPTFVCLSNGLCQPGPDTTRTYAYDFYRSGCTDGSFNSSSCPQFCTSSGYHNDRGQGVKKCGDSTYCCGASGDCCSDPANVFTLEAAEVVATISASSAYITSISANDTSTDDFTSEKNNHRALAIGLGVGISLGGFLLVALAVFYILKRKAKANANAGYEKKEEVSELDAPWKAQLPDSISAPTKAGYAAPADGVVHEIADGRTEPSVAPQELEANNTYDWEPRDEPQPRDGGFRPEEHTEYRPRR